MMISKFESFSELLFTAKVLVPFAFESNHPVQRWRRIIPGRSADRGSPSPAAKPAIHVHAFCLCIFESDDKPGMPCSMRFTWIHFPTKAIALRAERILEPINRVCMSKPPA